MHIRVFQVVIFFGIVFSCTERGAFEDDTNKVKRGGLVEEMESELSLLDAEIIALKDHFEFLIANKDSLEQYADWDKYAFKGAFSTNRPGQDSSLSSLIIMNSSLDIDQALYDVGISNGLDSAFSRIFSKYGIIAQVYANSANQVSRVYPVYDASVLVDPDLDVTKFNFYYEADAVNNPSKGPVWIPEAYVDPAGRGWILSVVHPVYEEGRLYAVLGIDITVDEILNRYLEKEEGDFLIVNGKGDIVAGKAGAIEALSFPPLKNHIYRETILEDNFRISDFNLFNSKSREVRKMAQAFLVDGARAFSFRESFNSGVAHITPFSMVEWYLIEVIPDSR